MVLTLTILKNIFGKEFMFRLVRTKESIFLTNIGIVPFCFPSNLKGLHNLNYCYQFYEFHNRLFIIKQFNRDLKFVKEDPFTCEIVNELLSVSSSIPVLMSNIPNLRTNIPDLRTNIPDSRRDIPELRGIIPQLVANISELRSIISELRSIIPVLGAIILSCEAIFQSCEAIFRSCEEIFRSWNAYFISRNPYFNLTFLKYVCVLKLFRQDILFKRSPI